MDRLTTPARRWAALSAVVGLLAAAPCAPAEESLTASQKVDKAFGFWDRQDQPGFAVVVVKDGQVVYRKVMGLACQELGVPITPGTLFQTAELAMPVTGLAVLTLEKQGRLDLDDDVRRHLPELPDLGAIVQLRHLLHHTSGLRDWRDVVRLQGREEAEIGPDDVLRVVRAQTRPAFAPGTRFELSHTNYDLLAEVVRRVSGQPLPEWAWQNVFKPLGMTRTLLREDDRAVIEGMAFPYNYTRADYRKGVDRLKVTGSHGLVTSLDDLTRWLVALSAGTLGGGDLVTRALTPGRLADGSSAGFGAGYFLGSNSRGPLARQEGSWAGWQAVLHFYPEKKLGIAVLANWDYTSLYFPYAIAAAFDPLPKVAPQQPAPEPKPLRPVKVKAAVLDVGSYRAGATTYEITRQDDKLVLGLGSRRYPLVAVSPTTFELPVAPVRLTFGVDAKGEVAEVTVDDEGEVAKAVRLALVHPAPAELAAYAGTYRSDELDLQLVVELRGEALALRPAGREPSPLVPDEKDRFTSGSPVFPLLVFARDGQGAVSGLSVDASGVRDVVFRRVP